MFAQDYSAINRPKVRGLDRTDLDVRKFPDVRLHLRLAQAQDCLRHRVHLVVVRSVWELYAFFNEIENPRRVLWMRQIDVAGFDKWADRPGPSQLPALRIHWNDSWNLPDERLDHSRTVSLVFDQLGQNARI